jgi:hypothetical protein
LPRIGVILLIGVLGCVALGFAECYLRATGVAPVWIDATGHLGAQDVASIENKPDRIVYCCERGAHFLLASGDWEQTLRA